MTHAFKHVWRTTHRPLPGKSVCLECDPRVRQSDHPARNFKTNKELANREILRPRAFLGNYLIFCTHPPQMGYLENLTLDG